MFNSQLCYLFFAFKINNSMAVDNPKLKNGLIMNAMAILWYRWSVPTSRAILRMTFGMCWFGAEPITAKKHHTQKISDTPHRALYAVCLLSVVFLHYNWL